MPATDLTKEFNLYREMGKRTEYEMALVKSNYLAKVSKIKKIQKVYREKREMDWDKMQKELLQ